MSNCAECQMLPRVDALEREMENNRKDHDDIFNRMRAAETSLAVQETHYNNILEKLVALTASHEILNQKLSILEAKPGKRWDGLVDKLIWAVAGAVVAFLLAKVGL